jgi:hypothetical protein
MALQNMYTQQGSFEDLYGAASGGTADGGMGALDIGFGDFANSIGQDFNSMREWTGGASAYNQELGGDGGWSYNMPGLQQMFNGYTFGARPTEGGGQLLDAMKGGQVVSTHRAGSDDNWFDKVGPYLPLLVGTAGLAAGAMGGAAAGGAGASGGAMSMGDAIAASAAAEGGAAAGAGAMGGGTAAGGLAGSAGGLAEMGAAGLFDPAIGQAAGAASAGGAGAGAAGATNIVGGALPMATPAPWAVTPGVGAGMTPAMGASMGAPMGAELSASLAGAGAAGGGTLGAMALEQPQMMTAGNYSDAAAGYGEPMSGIETSIFDGALGMGFSPEVANVMTNFGGPMMDNPVMDNLRRLKEMLGKPLGGSKLTGGDLLRGGMAANNYRQNSKNLRNQQNSLQSMFGPNSAYSQQLRQQLERRDAAAGRRSQYGPREVELQAQLAKMASGVAPAINQIGQQRMQQRGALTNTAGLLLDKGLGGMFGG